MHVIREMKRLPDGWKPGDALPVTVKRKRVWVDSTEKSPGAGTQNYLNAWKKRRAEKKGKAK